MSCPVIVNNQTNEVKSFENVEEITIGRNVTSSIDLPSPYISREQCILKLTGTNEWSLTDLSRHQTTLLNNVPLQGSCHILKNGDKISFMYHKDAEFTFYDSILDAPNPAKKRKLDPQPEYVVDLTPTPLIDEGETVLNTPQNHEVVELNNQLALLKEKYDSALEEINNQRIVNESATHKLNLVLKETNDTVSILQKENESLSNKLKEGELAKEQMLREIQELRDLIKESELEQMRLNDECKCKGQSSEEVIDVEQESSSKEKKDPVEPMTDLDVDALQNIVKLVDLKWNVQEMDLMKEELKKRDEKITDLTLETEKCRSEILDTVDREMLCSICNDILYQATTLNCKHTFCKVCVVEWKKKKKECPVCRTKIKTETQPLVIDSFIDKLAETIGGELKTRRAEVKQERASKQVTTPSTSGSRTRAAATNGRNNRRPRGNFNTISSAMSILQPLVIELTDHFGNSIVPPPIIDLTESPNITQRRARRGPIVHYYNV